MSFTPNPKPPTTWRLLLLIPGGLALLGGLNGAMMLLDLPVPVNEVRLRDGHGIILVMGFVGTLIALERAVALRKTWGYLAPICLGLGGLLFMSPVPTAAGRALLLAGSLGGRRCRAGRTVRAVVAPPQRPHRVGPTLGRSLAGRVSNFMAP